LERKPNIILIVSDTLRLDHLGCYGNDRVRTPNMDLLANQGVRFTRAFPESLPTIPVRRALHTGRRAYPFRDYRPVKWDIVYLPGWQPMDDDEDTLAENLAGAGYQTGLVTDTLPYFAPGFNFTRGFWQWEFIRGQQQDRWRSPYSVPKERLERYGDPEGLPKDIHSALRMHLANTAHVRGENDTTTARTFQEGMRFLEENQEGQPFFLMVDCFDPHEPWDAPENYYRIYGDPGYSGRRLIFLRYGPADGFGYSREEIEYAHAQYCAHVTLVDTWLGKFLRRLDELGLGERTAVILTSDHGTNFAENPRRIVGKPVYSMYPAVMRLPLILRLPGREARGVRHEFVYDVDIAATVYDLAGVKPSQPIDGRSLKPLLTGEGEWRPRPYVTCRYGESLCYIDSEYWVICDVDGSSREIFDLSRDPECQRDLAQEADPQIFERAWSRLLRDAGGNLPDYRGRKKTDALGR